MKKIENLRNIKLANIIGILLCLILFLVIIISLFTDLDADIICRNSGYNGTKGVVLNFDIEPGYIECYKYSYVDHKKITEYEIIKRDKK